jgi:hypothetical protein
MKHDDDCEEMIIPGNWTIQQADAVFNFLCFLSDAIFSKYEKSFCLLESERCHIEQHEQEEEKYKLELFKNDEDIPF